MNLIQRIGRGHFALVIVVACVGCGETKQDVITRYQQPCAQVRTKLKAYAANLPPLGTVTQVRASKGLNPLPVLDVPGHRGNTEIVMESQLTDPDSTPEFDLNLSRNLLRCLAWTGPKNPLAESARNSSAGSIEQDFQDALAWEYLGVVRVVNYVAPEVAGEDKYRGGDLKLEVFLIRVSDGQVVGAFPVRATAAKNVEFSYKETDSVAERARAFVHSSVWQKAREKVAEGLRQVTGGEFRLD